MGEGLVNGNPKVAFSQSHFSGTKISTTFAFLFAPIKTEVVLLEYRNLETTSSRHQLSSEDELHCLLLGGGVGDPLLNVFLRVYFDVQRQSGRFNFPPSKQSSFFSGTEIYIPQRLDISHHQRMNFTLLWGRGLVNGNPKVVCSQSYFLGTKISKTFALLFAPITKQSSFFSGTEIQIPHRVDTNHHLRMNFTVSHGGKPLLNVFLRVYFDFYRQSSRFNVRPSKQCSFFSGTEIQIPDRIDRSYHLTMNFTFSQGGSAKRES